MRIICGAIMLLAASVFAVAGGIHSAIHAYQRSGEPIGEVLLYGGAVGLALCGLFLIAIGLLRDGDPPRS